jgi:hypothetical protein
MALVSSLEDESIVPYGEHSFAATNVKMHAPAHAAGKHRSRCGNGSENSFVSAGRIAWRITGYSLVSL